MPISRLGQLKSDHHHLCNIQLYTHHPSGRSSAPRFKMQAVSIKNLPKEVLKKGLFVDGNKLIRLDCENHLCIELFARALTIVWGDTEDYWTYKPKRLSGGETIEVAKLLNVCWLEVHGEFDISTLSVGEYEVLFDIKLAPGAYGFTKPVKFTLTDANGIKIESERRINDGINKIPIGKFDRWSRTNKVGFRLYELNPQWKHGLIIRGVIIRAVERNIYLD